MNEQNDKIQDNKEKRLEEEGKQNQQLDQKKRFIKNEQSSFDYNKALLDKIKTIFKDALNNLQNFQSVKRVDQQEQDMENNEVINKMIEEIFEQINSIKKKLQVVQIFNTSPNQNQHAQLVKNREIVKYQEAKIQEKQEKITPQSIANDKEVINKDVNKLNAFQKINNQETYQTLNEKQNYLINHSQVQDQQDYYLILKYQLQQNMKTNINQQLGCLCNKKIKIKDLTNLSNRNMFELLLSKQIENILQTQNKIQVLSCKNSFCSFKCFTKKDDGKFDSKDVKSFCPLCEEFTVV